MRQRLMTFGVLMVKFFLSFFLIVFFCQSFAIELVIGTNQRDIYRFIDKQGHGKDIDLIEYIFSKLPYTYRIVEMPWARSLKSVETGAVDLTVAAANVEERRVYGLFSSHPYRYNYHMIFAIKDKISTLRQIKQLPDIINKHVLIGALRGAVYSEEYNNLLKNEVFRNKIVFLDNDQHMPDVALKGRVDAYIDAEIEGKYYISRSKKYRDNIVPLFRITSEEESAGYILFSKKTISQETVNEFDQVLFQLHSSGEYDRISLKYQKPKTRDSF